MDLNFCQKVSKDYLDDPRQKFRNARDLIPDDVELLDTTLQSEGSEAFETS